MLLELYLCFHMLRTLEINPICCRRCDALLVFRRVRRRETYHVEAPSLHFAAGVGDTIVLTTFPFDVLVRFIEEDKTCAHFHFF